MRKWIHIPQVEGLASRQAHADLPATGAPLLSDQISDIVDQRIKFQLKGFDHQIRAVDDRLENWFGNNLDIIDERITEVVRNMSFTVEVD